MVRPLAIFILVLSIFWVLPLAAQTEATIDLERIQRATVFISQVRSEDLSLTCVGSGTVVRYDGLILANAHNTVQSDSCPGDTLIVSMSLDLAEPPVPKYRAEIVQYDDGLDLALLRITQEFDGRIVEPGSLPVLPFVELGDSGAIELDNTVTLVGYGGVGNEPIQATRAVVSGFISEPSGGARSWLKVITDAGAAIPGPMTGGGAYNSEGRLIGIPTTAPTGEGSPGFNCRLIEDSNRDGFINNNDRCIALGEFISVMRPSAFARPLLRGASLGLRVERLTTPNFQVNVADAPSVSRLFFSPTVVDNLPTTVIGSAPAGTNSLYLFFDYRNMTPTTVYEVRVTIDGQPSETFSLPPVRWSGGTNGLWHVGSSGQPWPNGDYEFRILINGQPAERATITIGGPAMERPTFTNITFGVLNNGEFAGEGYILPAGNTVTARFVYRSMVPGTPWTALWYYNGTLLREAVANTAWTADDGANGLFSLPFEAVNGFLPGTYRLELYIDRLLAATGDFVIAGAQEGAVPRIFSDIRFIRTRSPLELPVANPSSSYPDGANTIYALFNWEQIAPGTLWTMRWRVDDDIFFQQTVPWNSQESGTDFTTRLTATGGLPDGRYTLELLVNNILLSSSTVSVGIGQLSIDELASASGALLNGRIIDQDTLEGISGATFVLISEDFSVADFTWDQEQIYALAITDREGYFEIDRPLRFESPYSVLIAVDGYLPVAADGFAVTPEDGSPIELTIPLTRD